MGQQQQHAPNLLYQNLLLFATGCLTLTESCLQSLGKYLVSFSSMSKNMYSLSGMEKDNRETSRQLAGKQNNNVTKREMWPTMGFIWVKEKKALVLPFVNEATRKLMTTMLMLMYPFYNFNGSMAAGATHNKHPSENN